MSRIGRMPITVPAGVEVKNDNNSIADADALQVQF